MSDRIVPWIALGALALFLTFASLVDTTATEPPEPEGNETPPPGEEPQPFVGPLQQRVGFFPTIYWIPALGLLFLGGLVAAFVWGDVLPTERRTLIMLAVHALVALFLAYSDVQNVIDPGTERRDPFLIPLAQTLLFFGACVFLVVYTHMDGFSQGSLVVLAFIELFVLWGWLGTPGGRSYVYHTNVTLAMMVLVAATLLFHQFQEERRTDT